MWVVWPMKMLNVEIVEYEQPERSLSCTRMSVLYLQKHGYVNMHKTCISGIMSLRSTIHTSSHWYGPAGLLIMPTTKHTEAGAAWLSASAERSCNKTQRDSDDTRVIRRVLSPQTTFYLSLHHVSLSGLSHTQSKTLNFIIQVLDGLRSHYFSLNTFQYLIAPCGRAGNMRQVSVNPVKPNSNEMYDKHKRHAFYHMYCYTQHISLL